MATGVSFNGCDISGDITTCQTIDSMAEGQTFFDIPTNTLYVCQSPNVLVAASAGGLQTAGAAGSMTTIRKVLTAMADNTFVDLCTITVPNAIMGAGVAISAVGILGDGDSAQVAQYNVAIARITGAATGVTAGAAIGAATKNGASGNAALSIQTTANVGANGATQTFKIQIKVARSAGSASNHVVVASIQLMNGFASGITIA